MDHSCLESSSATDMRHSYSARSDSREGGGKPAVGGPAAAGCLARRLSGGPWRCSGVWLIPVWSRPHKSATVLKDRVVTHSRHVNAPGIRVPGRPRRVGRLLIAGGASVNYAMRHPRAMDRSCRRRGHRHGGMSAQRCCRFVIGSMWKSAIVLTSSSKSVLPSRR